MKKKTQRITKRKKTEGKSLFKKKKAASEIGAMELVSLFHLTRLYVT